MYFRDKIKIATGEPSVYELKFFISSNVSFNMILYLHIHTPCSIRCCSTQEPDFVALFFHASVGRFRFTVSLFEILSSLFRTNTNFPLFLPFVLICSFLTLPLVPTHAQGMKPPRSISSFMKGVYIATPPFITIVPATKRPQGKMEFPFLGLSSLA